VKGQANIKLRSQGMPPLGKGGDDGVLQIICNHVKPPIKLYNNLYEEIKHFEPLTFNYEKNALTQKYFF
jgi:hypothetical protein